MIFNVQPMVKALKDNRPVNLDIGTFKLPITAWASIAHRGTGVMIFGALIILMLLLDCSLSSEEGFAHVQELLDGFFVKLIIWGVLAGLIYHSCAGVKHLIMDAGIGETLEGGQRLAWATIMIAGGLIGLTGLWLFVL